MSLVLYNKLYLGNSIKIKFKIFKGHLFLSKALCL